jgi:hypothetical protein
MGSHVGDEGVGEVVVHNSCMLESVAPEVSGSIRCEEEAASDLHQLLVACLCNAVLLR